MTEGKIMKKILVGKVGGQGWWARSAGGQGWKMVGKIEEAEASIAVTDGNNEAG